jgi:hemin uptake protein HemP
LFLSPEFLEQWGPRTKMSARQNEDNAERGDEREQSFAGTRRHVSIANDRLDSRELFVGTREITILHGGDAYHLRLTAQNKLILTK